MIITAANWDSKRWPNFSPSTDPMLACPRAGGVVAFDDRFLDLLQSVRVALGRSMQITSGCRTTAHNDSIGGARSSLHICDVVRAGGQTGALAVDIAAVDGQYRGDLFAAAWWVGLSIGWNAKRKFLHLDARHLIGMPKITFDY